MYTTPKNKWNFERLAQRSNEARTSSKSHLFQGALLTIYYNVDILYILSI